MKIRQFSGRLVPDLREILESVGSRDLWVKFEGSIGRKKKLVWIKVRVITNRLERKDDSESIADFLIDGIAIHGEEIHGFLSYARSQFTLKIMKANPIALRKAA